MIKKRRSIRAYKTRKVPFSKIVKICEAARYAPMAGNIYTIRLIVVEDKEKKAKLAEASFHQDFIAEASHVIVVCSDLSLLKRSYGERAFIYGRQQAGAAIQNMLLKITELGLASCWIGAFDENAVKRILRIPESIQVEALLPVGFGREKPREIVKPELKTILNFEFYGLKVSKKEPEPGA